MDYLVRLRDGLLELGDAGDESAWPEEGLRRIRQAGLLGAVIPRRYGGSELSPCDQVAVYEHVGAGSLALALILTQHDRACELLADGGGATAAADLLPRCATGETLLTVGISQLTTSKRGKGPALRAQREADGAFVLDGRMPWVTSAPRAEAIVTGAVLDDGMQVLACVRREAAGVTVEEPLELLALTGTETSVVRCAGVRVAPANVVRGPGKDVLGQRAPVKPLVVSTVGIGLAGTLMDDMRRTSLSVGAELRALVERAGVRYAAMRERVYSAARCAERERARRAGQPAGGAEVRAGDGWEAQRGAAEAEATSVRVAVNDLLVRLAASAMVLAKGSGYVRGRRAERLLREAAFFLVWSAPDAVRAGTVETIWNADTRENS